MDRRVLSNFFREKVYEWVHICIVSNIWDLLSRCGSVRKIGVDSKSTFRSRVWVMASFPSTKMLTQEGAISPQIFVSAFN
jgi:hypothetical protein